MKVKGTESNQPFSKQWLQVKPSHILFPTLAFGSPSTFFSLSHTIHLPLCSSLPLLYSSLAQLFSLFLSLRVFFVFQSVVRVCEGESAACCIGQQQVEGDVNFSIGDY